MARSSISPITRIVEFFRTASQEQAEMVYGLVRDVMKGRQPIKTQAVNPPRKPRTRKPAAPLAPETSE